MAKGNVKTPITPNIVQTFCDKDGRTTGYIADNCVEDDPAGISEHLESIARIWANEEAKAAAERSKNH